MSSQSSSVTGINGIWTTFFGTVDLRGTVANVGIVTPGFTNVYGISASGLSFGSTWTFDTSTRIYICSSITGTNSASCYVKSIDFWYTYIGGLIKNAYMWGVQRNLFINFD